MDSLSSSLPQWIPEDDFMLKNAIESGASLEALAKGAVRFSRKFSVQELRNRWHSLLFDPVVSDEASTFMVDLEHSADRCRNSRQKMEVPAKRKFDSVRRMYYAMRKRICSQPFQSLASYVGHSSDFQEQVGPPDDVVFGDCMNSFRYDDICEDMKGTEIDKEKFELKHDESPVMEGNLVQFGNVSGVEKTTPSQEMSYVVDGSPVQPGSLLWKTIEDISVPIMPSNINNENEEKMYLPSDDLDAEKLHRCASEELKLNNSSNFHEECNFGDLPDSLLNLTNKDGPICMDSNEKDTIKKPPDENCDSILSNASIDVHPDGAPLVVEAQALVFNSKVSPATSEVNVSSSRLMSNMPIPCIYDEEMECVLNTEDPEVPNNDHVIFVKACNPPRKLQKTQRKGRGATHPTNPTNIGKEISSIKKEEKIKNIYNALLMVSGITSPKARNLQKIVSTTDKSVFHGVGCQLVSSTHIDEKKLLESSQYRQACGSATYGLAKKNAVSPVIPNTSADKILELDPSPMYQDEYESDDDLPCFSDIEAMILKMDLSPDDSDSCLTREARRYQHDNAKRDIIRLEQCAQSAMQRTNRDALAIMYGHHVKHYIRKSVVLIGRSTEDFNVDIDLGKEDCANKISRRQALLKLEENGSFSLKNLGKYSIYLNGKEIVSGQTIALARSSLIEIKDVAFVFESNQKSVQRYLAKIKKKQENGTRFEWSEQS